MQVKETETKLGQSGTLFPGFVISKIMPSSVDTVCYSSRCLIGLTFAISKVLFHHSLPLAAKDVFLINTV